MMLKGLLPLALALLCISVFGQSPASTERSQTVHVQGTIFDPAGAVVPGTEVAFHSDQVTEMIKAGGDGFYQTNLPAGLYTMAAQPRGFGTRGVFWRPLFRVPPVKNLTLDVYLRVVRTSCDLGIATRSGEQIVTLPEDNRKDICGGDDSFPIPSGDGAQFQLFIRYPYRLPVHSGWLYDTWVDNSDQATAKFEAPVLVEYNLFTLQADVVQYVAKSRRLEARGHVVVVNELGSTYRADSVTYTIENGRAMPVQ
jgi:hypothetical protein